MTFLQPALLAALPLVLLPLVIHLIHRQRYQSRPWAAMMFLLDARKMARGMARLRYWLIMALRMLAIGLLILAAARPLSSGWFGLFAGGRADTTIVLLDRSASMGERAGRAASSKRSTGLEKLSRWLETTGGGTRVVLIDSAGCRAREVPADRPLAEQSGTRVTAATADLPAMLAAAQQYMVANQTGRTDVWICSDLRKADWKPDDGRWATLRTDFERLPAARFHLLSYPAVAEDNVAIRIDGVRKRRFGTRSELALDLSLDRPPRHAPASRQVSVELVVNGARSALQIAMTGHRHEVTGHTIVLDRENREGWGRVAIDDDANPHDNRAYFVFADPPEHKTVIVTDRAQSVDAIEVAATAPADVAQHYQATRVSPTQGDQIDFASASLIVWHARLPAGQRARQLHHAVARGCSVLFLPPEQADAGTLFGCRWGTWHETDAERPATVVSWRGDSDLLRHDRSRRPLPLDALRVRRYRTIEGQGTRLATLAENQPLLIRAAAEGGRVYFCATLPDPDHSNLASNGVVLYALLHRAISAGSQSLGKARQWLAGSPSAQAARDARPLDDRPGPIASVDRPYLPGAYQRGETLFAINRPPREDALETLDRATLDTLFQGLDYRLVDDPPESDTSLANETWRAFLVTMALALIGEASLCLRE